MKSYNKSAALLLSAGVVGMIGSFSKPLGIPQKFEIIPLLACLVLLLFGFREFRKAKAAGQLPRASKVQIRKQRRLMVAVMAVTCASGPFVLPYTVRGELPFLWYVAISVITFFIMLGALWWGTKIAK